LHCIAIAFWIGIGIVLQKVLFFKKLYNIILALHSSAAVLKPAQACLVNYLSKFYIFYQTNRISFYIFWLYKINYGDCTQFKVTEKQLGSVSTCQKFLSASHS
jgi:hypothetical protein